MNLRGDFHMKKDVPVLEFCLALILILFSISLYLQPSELRGNLPPIFTNKFIEATTTDMWGTVYLIVAVLVLLGITAGQKLVRKIGVTGAMILFGLMAAGAFSRADGYSLGGGIFTILCFLSLWSLRYVKEG